MSKQPPEEVDREFFEALINADVASLDRILASDFVLIDVMTGSEVSGETLTELVRLAQLRFHTIDQTEYKVRVLWDNVSDYGPVRNERLVRRSAVSGDQPVYARFGRAEQELADGVGPGNAHRYLIASGDRVFHFHL